MTRLTFLTVYGSLWFALIWSAFAFYAIRAHRRRAQRERSAHTLSRDELRAGLESFFLRRESEHDTKSVLAVAHRAQLTHELMIKVRGHVAPVKVEGADWSESARVRERMIRFAPPKPAELN